MHYFYKFYIYIFINLFKILFYVFFVNNNNSFKIYTLLNYSKSLLGKYNKYDFSFVVAVTVLIVL